MGFTAIVRTVYIHLYSHKLQLHKQEIKKNKGKKEDTQRVKEHCKQLYVLSMVAVYVCCITIS